VTGTPSGDRGLAVGPSGRYLLGTLLGRGGMADVYRAQDRTLGRDVAVKMLRERTADPSDRERFVAEARTLARLNHPNLVTILDAGTDEEHPYLVLELVTGPSLAEALRESGNGLPFAEVARIGAQLAAALAHCHAAGIVHRDVKPGNILLAPGGRALLTDFGIARLLDDSVLHTRTGFTIGTASYLAPEQVRGDHLTPAVDLYSLGLVLIEAGTGRRSYTGTPVEAAMARLHRRPEIPAGMPPALGGVLHALTDSDPVLRPSATEAAATLTKAVPGPSTPATTGSLPVTGAMQLPRATAPEPPEAAEPGPATTATKRRRTPVLLVGAAAAALAVALGVHGPSFAPSSPATDAPVTKPTPVADQASPSPAATQVAQVSTGTTRPSGAAAKAPAPSTRSTAKGPRHTSPAKKVTRKVRAPKASKPAPKRPPSSHGHGHGHRPRKGK
jgi:serine/threonine protein kinase